MPLLDPFHPPLSRTHPWRSFHAAWAVAMAHGLNDGVLPPGYYAVPFLDSSGPIEIDVAALQEFDPAAKSPQLATRSWAAPAPEMVLDVDWPLNDSARVEVLSDEGDPPLAAAIELVSPSNKDRPRAREAFVAKCAEYLRRGCGLVVLDVVTTRRAVLQADLMSFLGIEPPASAGSLSAVAYRAISRDAEGHLEVWASPLEVGQPLPTLPLWLKEQAVPLDLEASHQAACDSLRIPHAAS